MKKIMILMLCSALLTACVPTSIIRNSEESSYTEGVTPYIQEKDQLYIDTPERRSPINYQKQIGLWIPYMRYADLLYGKSEDEFRSAIREYLSDAKAESINTIYLHVHPNGDAYYRSEIFPKGTYYDGDYDPLQIALEEAHDLQLSVHAWINPLRSQTVEQMSSLPDSFILKQWVNTPDSDLVKVIGDRYYLDPAYEEVTQLLADCVDEIITGYDVDGIHIDDYFYPTSDPKFDRKAFEKSGSTDLAQWRLDNSSRFVKAIYDTVKAHDDRLLFGISPQGNINANYTSQFADVRKWGSEDGFCDYIVPQIYFGFENETCPFVPTLEEWEALVSDENVSLIVGLGAYKLGKEDKWAGSAGEQEWINNPDIINQQIEIVNNSPVDGYALYY